MRERILIRNADAVVLAQVQFPAKKAKQLQ